MQEHIFRQAFPLGAEEYSQENLTGAFLHSQTVDKRLGVGHGIHQLLGAQTCLVHAARP